MNKVLRMQDAEGRGPWRPGLSARWRDPAKLEPPPYFDEFGDAWRNRVPRGWHVGCALIDLAMAARWFSRSEYPRLAALGFALVELRGAIILCRSTNQLVIARERRFAWGAKAVAWPEVAA